MAKEMPSTDLIDIRDVPLTGIELPIFDCDAFSDSKTALQNIENNKIRELLVS